MKIMKQKKGYPFNNVPTHIARLSVLLINNAEIRRFTAIGIRNYLINNNIVKVKDDSMYIKFLANKFAVKCNGLKTEYSYAEPFFLNCFLAAFPSFAASANKAIENFCQEELGVDYTDVIDQVVIDSVTQDNLKHIKCLDETQEDSIS